MEALRAAIIAQPDWASIKASDLAARLKAQPWQVHQLFSRDPELVAGRKLAQERLLAFTRDKIKDVPGWEDLPVTVLTRLLQLPGMQIRIALRAIRPPLSASKKKGKSNKHGALIRRMEAIPNWTVSNPPELAKLLRIPAAQVLSQIHRVPCLKEAWTRDRSRRLDRAWYERSLQFDFRKIENWETMRTPHLLKAMGVKLWTLRLALARNPALQAAWNKRRPYTFLQKRKCEFYDVAGWQTMRKEDIAKVMGISRSGFDEVLGRNPGMYRDFKRGHRGFSKWTPENIAAVQAHCDCAEAAAGKFKVRLDVYRQKLRRLGIPPLPSRDLTITPDFATRLVKIKGWREMSYTALSRRLGQTASHTHSMLYRHPELLAQRQRKPDWLHRYKRITPRIMAVPGWKTITLASIHARTGIHPNTITFLMQCVPQLFEQRSRLAAKPWLTFSEDIQAVPGWKTKTARELGRHLARPKMLVKCAIMENETLREQWRPRSPGKVAMPLRQAILAVPGWRHKTAREITAILGKGPDPQSVKRCLAHIWIIERRTSPSASPGVSSSTSLRRDLRRIPYWSRCTLAYLARELRLEVEDLQHQIENDGELAFKLAEGRKFVRQRLVQQLRRIVGWRTAAMRVLVKALGVSAEQIREAISSDAQVKSEWSPPDLRRPWNHGLPVMQAA